VCSSDLLDSYPWRTGDTLAILGAAYPGVMNAARRLSERRGVALRPIRLEPPFGAADALASTILGQLDASVRLLLIDHISSQYAVVYPVERLIAECRARAVHVLVDGAHAPGMLPLDLTRLAADWYVGNAHKWLYAPKGCGFIWANPSTGIDIHPLMASVHWGEGLHREFDWQGTRDPTAWLAIGAALDFMRDLNENEARRYMFELAEAGAALLYASLGAAPQAPVGMSCAMASIQLPSCFGAGEEAAKALHDALWRDARIEVPVIALDGHLSVRISAQVYNQMDDYAALAEALAHL
jgi:isopenicillin-N epimerase